MKRKTQQINNIDAMAVVKATYTKSRGGAKAAIRYIQHRKDREGGNVTRELYGAEGVIKRQDAYQMIDDAEKGTVYFRFVISPDQNTEDTKKDLQLQTLTRQTMLALQEQLGSRVPYVAAVHDDHTELRHVHLIACVTSRLDGGHFQTMRDAATEEALLQRQERDRAREQQREGGK
jgi:hypothetical protein